MRRQLGTGIDPAYDYSAMEELQKKLANAGRKGAKERAERAHEGSAAPASGLDLLKKTLKEVVGVGAGLEETASEQAEADGNQRRARSSPGDAQKRREMNSSAFLAPSRDDLKKLDVENRLRAPPIGSYNPGPDPMHTKQPCHVFGKPEKTKSRKQIAIDKEIKRLLEEGEDVEHLTKPGCTSLELQEGTPCNRLLIPRQRNYEMAKDLPRPDLMKQMNCQYYDNSFTAGVLDGKERTSAYRSQPSWDFAKLSTAPEKLREYYFQPGQYAVKWDIARPKINVKNIGFEKQPNRKQLATHVPAGIHLPDRSLSRPSAMSQSCPQMERRVKDIHIGKCTDRKPIYDYKPPMYDTSDPRIEEEVLKKQSEYDCFKAMRQGVTHPRQSSCEDFGRVLNRTQHHKTMRSYATDVNIQMMNKSLVEGVVSVEMLPMGAIHDHDCLKPSVITKDLKKMAGREVTKEHRELPPRGQVEKLEGVMNFDRGTRSGDCRADAANLSKLAGAITELRGTRTYDALPIKEHPRPSLDANS